MRLLAYCLLLTSVLAASCGPNREGTSQPTTSIKRTARWTAQYQSPLSARYAGTQLLGLFSFNAVSVVSSEVVFVAADYPEAANVEKRYALVLKTTDGGRSWAEIPISRPGAKIVALNGIHFLDSALGWVIGIDSAGRGIILKTSDGGATWTSTGIDAMLTPTSLFFTDAQHGWVGGFARNSEGEDEGGATDILVTDDGGATWRAQRRIPVSINDFFFLDQKTGWAAGSGGTIYSTTDAGATWNSQRVGLEDPSRKSTNTPPVRENALDNSAKPGARNAVKNPPRSEIPVQNIVAAVHFASASHGWAVCREAEGDSSVIVGTENGGASWARLFGTNAERIRDLLFVSETEGWATLWASQYVYHTTDGGKQWEAEQVQFEQYPPLYKLAAADSSHVWAVGGGAIFVRTSER